MFCGYWIWGLGFLIVAGTISGALGILAFLLARRKRKRFGITILILVTSGTFVLMVLGCFGYFMWCWNDFGCDEGFADYWRIPVRYPYQISAFELLDEGCLDIWQESNSNIACGITHYATKDEIMMGRIGPTSFHSERVERWFSFRFDTAELVYYSTEEAFKAACEEFGLMGKPELRSVREHYYED